MRRLICLVIVFSFMLIYMSGNSYCSAAESKTELDYDYMIPKNDNRDIDTVSLHILKKISETQTRSIYRGITITRPQGNIFVDNRFQDSSAVGVGPIYMIRDEKYHSGKLTASIDMSGGFILYDKVFPAGGECYNFMWRIGPQLTYNFNENSSVHVGYMLMHVSNGLKTHNPGYDARGISLGVVSKF